MYGLVFEIVEEWVIEKQGLDVWHKIKDHAGNKRKDQTYLRRAYYEDEELVDLINAASELLSISVPDILEAFGHFVIMHHFANGYAELLICQGSTLRQWLSNLNAMHDYVQRSFPGENFIAPIFWCEDCDEVEGSILLHYYTLRGTLLVPMVVGIVEQLASYHFELEVKMNQIGLQGEDGADFTTWRISAVDESQKWKLSPKSTSEMEAVSFEGVAIPQKCPFSGRTLKRDTNDDPHQAGPPAKCPFHSQLQGDSQSASQSVVSSISKTSNKEEELSFKAQHLKDLFPFHILVDQDFTILQLGQKLPRLLNNSAHDLRGLHIGEVVEITRPLLGSSWDWKSLNKLFDQNFFLTPLSKASSLHKKVSMADSIIRFKASMYRLSADKVMFTLNPDANNVSGLNHMGLTLSDLPLSSCQRDAIFLGEHVAQEADKAHKLDKLSKRLAIEKDLSNVLLNNMLPQKVAENLREGKTVEPVFHEHVTLFFSDVVGFTSICDQVEPWAVIDMMNQLYSVMDHLASHFDLYKVETVGDAYLCASGLPEPEEYHAEKIANFALAVVHCVQHVKSPVDGSPIQLRIGIHTGSCTSGVVGTLTPHYCLFGDTVNTAARHESTGVAGKIQCSSVLYGLLEHFSNIETPQYNFKARGLVDMKGKGEHYTYWLETATEGNAAVNEHALNSLSSQVEEILGAKTWKRRRYFGRGGIFRGNGDADTASLSGLSNDGFTLSTGSSGEGSISGSTGSIVVDSEDEDLEMIPTTIIDFPEGAGLGIPEPWAALDLEEEKSFEEMISESLSKSLWSCIQKSGKRMEVLQDELRAFVITIAKIYMGKDEGNALCHIARVLQRCDFLWEARDKNSSKSQYALGTNPWDRFVLLFSAFVHQVKHTGSSNATLESERHVIAQMYEGLSSCQQRRSVDFTFALMENEFGDLYEEIIFGCPNFASLVRKAVVCTDLESESTVRKMLAKCEELNSMKCTDERQERRRNEANIGLVLAMATVGSYTQSLDHFLQFSSEQYDKVMKSCDNDNSGESWYYEQTMFMKDVVLLLIEEVLAVLPRATYLEEGATQNIDYWDKRGKEWLAASKLKKAKLHGAVEGSFVPQYHVEKLVAVNVDMLETLLAQVMVTREGNGITCQDDAGGSTSLNPYEEIQMFIEMKKSPIQPNHDCTHQLGDQVLSELRQFVSTIANGYEKNRFHNFLHASHVAHLANLLVKGIHPTEDADDTCDLAHDPFARFAIVLSALVHDVGHTGVPNGQLAEEKPHLADKYCNKSIAEQNSIDTAWNILMSDSFKNLQDCLFESRQERDRFRQLLVNCVMATDIFDQDLRVMRKSRWEKAFSEEGSFRSDEEEGHYKATIVIEHIMQASDVAHTMQEWEIYRQWNESLFREMYEAHKDGRAVKDPSDSWYDGELWFFDNWVIPLAQNLKECGVLDVVSDQLVKQARSNRQRWKLEGEQISKELCSGFKRKPNPIMLDRSPASMYSVSTESSSSATYLASQMVTEVESLSKVMARYKRKYESALGNLIALAYKGHPCEMDLKKQELSDVHYHFKQQDWYRFHAGANKLHRRASKPTGVPWM